MPGRGPVYVLIPTRFPKVLIHVAGKPILGHILDELKQIGIQEVIFVIGYRGDMVINYVKKNYSFDVKFVRQEELLGLGHAIYLAKDLCENEPVMIVLGDTVFKADFSNVMKGDCSYIGVKEVADPPPVWRCRIGSRANSEFC